MGISSFAKLGGVAVSINIGSFVAPLNQFEQGETAYACVAFGCADIYYSGPSGGKPTGTAEDVDVLADQWYKKFTGSIAPSSTSGLSIEQEYQMLSGIGLHYRQINPSVGAVEQWLGYGYPVLICGAETGFFDVGLGKIPYGWTPAGNHAIVACGIDTRGNLLVRDYANIPGGPGSTRPYDSAKMRLVSATAVTPRWFKPFAVPAPPIAAPAPVPAIGNKFMEQQASNTWNHFLLGLGMPPLPYDTGIAAAWRAAYPKQNFGSPLGPERSSVDWKGVPIKVQLFSGGIRCEWNTFEHNARFYDAAGKQVA
jgi:hypothetical protein